MTRLRLKSTAPKVLDPHMKLPSIFDPKLGLTELPRRKIRPTLRSTTAANLRKGDLVYIKRADIHQRATARESEAGYLSAYYLVKVIEIDGELYIETTTRTPDSLPGRYLEEGQKIPLRLFYENTRGTFFTLKNLR